MPDGCSVVELLAVGPQAPRWYVSVLPTEPVDNVLACIEQHARVRVVPGSPRWFGAGAAGHMRLSLATTRNVLDEALTRIERAWPAIIAR